MYNKVIVLGADKSYKRQILATIKSICYHNRDVMFYLINNDIDDQWLKSLNKNLSSFGSKIESIKIEDTDISSFKTYEHISSATYFRYYISEKIREERLLYIDSDLVINGKLDEIFNLNIDEYALAASIDMISELFDTESNEFNAGVMYINNSIWKRENFLNKALNIHFEDDKILKNGDQSVLNLIFKDRFLEISSKYNFQVGVEFINKIDKLHMKSVRIEKPLIVHFTSANKPWNKKKMGILGRIKLMGVLSLKEFFTGKIKSSYDDLWFFYDKLDFNDTSNWPSNNYS